MARYKIGGGGRGQIIEADSNAEAIAKWAAANPDDVHLTIMVTRLEDILDFGSVDWASLPAEDKVKIITAMGFKPMRDPHTHDCPRNFGRGLNCQCVPDATVWTQPADVDVFRHETWEERLAAARAKGGD